MSSKRFTLSITEDEEAVIERVIATSDLAGLGADRNTMIRFILRRHEKLQQRVVELEAEKVSLIQTALTTRASSTTVVKQAPAPKLSYLEKKEQKEKEAREEGVAICNELGGRVEGEICVFKKYEVTAGGLAFEGVASEQLVALPGLDWVNKQYDPSKEAYEAAKNAGRVID